MIGCLRIAEPVVCRLVGGMVVEYRRAGGLFLGCSRGLVVLGGLVDLSLDLGEVSDLAGGHHAVLVAAVIVIGPFL